MILAETTTMGGMQQRLAAPSAGPLRRYHGFGTRNTRATCLARCQGGLGGRCRCREGALAESDMSI